MLLDNWLAQRAETCPDRAAVVAGRAAARLRRAGGGGRRRGPHGALAAQGVRRDSVVAISMPPSVEYAVALHALMKLGAIAVPIDPRLGAEERARLLRRRAPRADDRRARTTLERPRGRPAAARGARRWTRPARRILTSGTVGIAARRSTSPTATTSGARSARPSTSGWTRPTAGSAACRSSTSRASRSCCARRSTGPPRSSTTASTSTAWPSRCSEDEVTIVSLVTTMLTRLLDAGAAIERPRALLVGGGPVPDEVLEEALGLGATVVQTYGLTEAVLAGDDALAGRGRAQARLGGPAAADDPRPDRRRRDPGPGARPSRRAPPTRTAGSTPATAGGSTRRASSGSRAAATT